MKKKVLTCVGSLTFLNSIALFAQEAAKKTAEVADQTAIRGAGDESMFDLIMLGGYVMIPLGLCSLVVLTLLIERTIVLKKKNIVPETFFPGLKDIITERKPNLDKAFEYCVKNGSPIAKILQVGIEKWKRKRTIEKIEKDIEDAAMREIGELERSLRGFKIVASLAPLLGLLGTVYGMINAFQTVAQSTDAIGKAAKLAHGIYEAMVTTAAGLTIAIPTLLIYYYFARKVDAYADSIEATCTEFIDECQDAMDEV